MLPHSHQPQGRKTCTEHLESLMADCTLSCQIHRAPQESPQAAPMDVGRREFGGFMDHF